MGSQIKNFLDIESTRKELDNKYYVLLKCLKLVVVEKNLTIKFYEKEQKFDIDFEIK